MEFDWDNSPLDEKLVTRREVEESFEDPFGIRIMPETDRSETRYYILGRTISGRGLFSVFWTDGKRYRVIQSREMTEGEAAFYERKNSDPSQ